MLIAEWTNKKKDKYYFIYRNKEGKWFVHCNDRVVQKRLTAKEIVRYLANALEGK